ncbi:MAG: NEAT domain-containing protein [Lachnospiraceae bacterium]|nr:NEAT domain-containing protein [Lachnospiraceae bacterium]
MKKIRKGILTFLLIMSVIAGNVYPFLSSSIATVYASETETTLDKLKALLEEAKKLNESDYTPESWTDFVDIRDSIIAPDEIPEKYQQTILDGLQEAMDNLVKVETTLDKLKALLEEAKKLNESDYTPESWTDFVDIRDSITAPDEIPEKYQQAILDGLQEAMDNLVKVETTLDKLKALLEEAKKLNESDYTLESWAEFADVRDSITEPDEIPERYQQAILNQLQNAIKQLVKKPEISNILEDGTYAVQFQAYADREKSLTGNSFVEGGRQALVVAKDGKYEVTFRKTDNLKDVLYQVLKQKYYSDTKTLFGQKAGTKNWIEGYDYQNANFNAALKPGFVEENDKYWIDTNYDIYNNYTDFTVELEDISADILLYTATADGQTRMLYIDFDENTAQKISVDEYKTTEAVTYNIFTQAPYGKKVPEDMLDNKSTFWSVADDTASAGVNINEQYQETFRAAQLSQWCKAGDGIAIENDAIKLSFNLSDEKDIALGKTVYYKYQLGYGETYITLYPSMQETESFEIEDNIACAKIATDTTVLSKETKLVADEIVDDPKTTEDGYSLFHTNLDGASKNMYMYCWNYEFKTGIKSINTSRKVTMKFKIPEGWENENVRLAYWGGDGTGGIDPLAKGSVDIIGPEDGFYVVKTDRIGYFCLYELKDTTATGENLTDGTYQVPINVYHMLIDGQLSMADQCLADIGKVVVKNGVKTLYSDFTTVTNTGLGLTGYMTKMWLYGSDLTMNGNYPAGTLNPVIFTSYYKNDDGSYLTDVFNENSLNYYPREGYVQLVSDNAKWPARFKVPVMDAIGGGSFEQSAWLTLDWANAEKISDETPDAPIKDALGETINIAETAVKEEYTEDTWKALEGSYNTAVEVYKNSTDNDKLTKAYTDLQAAIDGLKKPDVVSLEDGLYTATGTTGDTNIVTGTRMLISTKGEGDEAVTSTQIYMDVQGIKGLAYYDLAQKAYVDAVTEKDEDGAITRVNLTIGNVSNMVSIRYKDSDGKEVSATLNFSDFVKQEVDKSKLTEAIANANEKLAEAAKDPDRYDTDKIAALQSAVAAAAKVNNDGVAIQTEVDAQTEAVNAAVSDLSKTASKEALQNAVTEAEKINGDAYTPKSFQTLVDAIASAKELLDTEGVTAQALEAAVLKLEAAREGLVARADKTELQKVYDEAAAITNQGYVGWDILQTTLEKAKKVLDDANATAIQVSDQMNAIKNAVNNLDGGIDKSVLIGLIEEAEKLDVSAYSDASTAYFKAAITSAKATVNHAGATQQGIDKQIQLLQAASEALVQKAQDNTVYDGTYTIDGRMWHASADQASMGNAALVKPMQIIVKTDENGNTVATLRMEYHAMTTSLGTGKFTGYLAALNYFPGWEGGESGYQMPVNETPVPAEVESYYEGVYDNYNDPTNGTDANVKGKLYPHFMVLPVDLNDDEIWVQVYVPVMESLNTGSGTQYAKLQLDWNTLKQISGAETNKEDLNALIEKAQALLDGLKDGDTGNTAENVEMLKSAIATANDVSGNLNVDQTAVDATAKGLQAAMNVFSEEIVKVDKKELKKAIDVADTYLKDQDIVYTEESKAILQNARDYAQKVYEDDQATLTQVNSAVTSIDNAIKSLQIDGTDKRELKKVLESAKSYLTDTENYSAAAIEALQALFDQAKNVYEDGKATQEEIDAQIRILNYAVANMKKVEEITVDKSGLHSMLLSAANMAGRESLYTAETIKNLKSAITAAEKVYQNKKATQAQVNEQASNLSLAMLALEVKPVENTGGNNNGNSDNNNGNNNDNNNNNNISGLDITKLADGVYSITGSAVKIDKTTASMSNEAINHNIKLTVKDGKYYLTLDFAGLNINGSFGYLGTLKYFKSGYMLDKYGAPAGTLADVTIDDYQLNSDGSKVKDNLGTDYPNHVTFPMLSEALKDGYVPLQVFVPIMESISAGTGTQPVFLKLDWSTIKATTADDNKFEDNKNNNTGSSNNNSGSNSLLSGGNTLSSGSSGLSSTGSKLTSGSTGLTSGSSSLKSSSTGLGSGSSPLKSGTTSLKSGTDSLTGTTGLSSSLSGGTKLAGNAATGSKAKTTTKAGDHTTNTSAAAVPLSMSLLAVLAGVLYKLKSRGMLKFF